MLDSLQMTLETETFVYPGSGSLDHAEIRRILVMLELDMSDQEFEDMVVAVDEDGTGDVSCDEFVDLMVLRSLDTMIK